MAELPAGVADSLVTDPPAGISFMGKEWDANKGGRREWVAWLTQVAAASMRVMKPGAHGLVWALPRTSHWTATALEDAGFEVRDVVMHLFGTGFPKTKTVLKPAAEHWILIRRPLAEQTVTANVNRYGTGTLNIDACRTPDGGRWPANLILSEPAEDAFSNAAKFLYVAKPSTKEKDAGLEAFPLVASGVGALRDAGRGKLARNTHPTVKAIALMRYLVRLITPPGGTVLDPFMGSGSTGVAALREGFDFIGIEREQEYFDTARARILACRNELQAAIKESA